MDCIIVTPPKDQRATCAMSSVRDVLGVRPLSIPGIGQSSRSCSLSLFLPLEIDTRKRRGSMVSAASSLRTMANTPQHMFCRTPSVFGSPRWVEPLQADSFCLLESTGSVCGEVDVEHTPRAFLHEWSDLTYAEGMHHKSDIGTHGSPGPLLSWQAFSKHASNNSGASTAATFSFAHQKSMVSNASKPFRVKKNKSGLSVSGGFGHGVVGGFEAILTNTTTTSSAGPAHGDGLLRESSNSASLETGATTLMVRNLPRRKTRCEIEKLLLAPAFADAYDFMFLPFCFHSHSNHGYAFINFTSNAHAVRFMKSWDKKRLSVGKKNRNVSVTVAETQGKEANIRLSIEHQRVKPETSVTRALNTQLLMMHVTDEMLHPLVAAGDQYPAFVASQMV